MSSVFELLKSELIIHVCRRYKKRCHQALVAQSTPNPTVMSLIIDGMDQGKCVMPYGGRQDSFGQAMHQHITGVKQHGVGLTLYRTTETVIKGANLTIYCILDRLEAFFKEHYYYPETLYIQVDGGSENANKFVPAMLELLIAKRVCKDIWYTRLPTGHTHEDIDGCFGTIWSALCAEPLVTMDDWRNAVKKAFNETTLVANIKDVWTVPDYSAVIEPCIIRNLGLMHREMQTQHQWRFRAVQSCFHFPFGCKTTFRAYSSDCVVEFIRKARHNCISEIGRFTGLEATKLYVRWFPSAVCDPNRPGVEGMYLLESLPSIELRPGAINPPPTTLPEKAIVKIDKCINEIKSRFHCVEHFAIREWWRLWEVKYRPQSANINDYVIQLCRNGTPYHVPLQDILFSLRSRLEPTSLTISIDEYADYDPHFQWPEVFSRATNSVQSANFNPHPPPPREYASSDVDLQDDIGRWHHGTAVFYQQTLDQRTIEQLKSMFIRKVRYSGEFPTLPSTKSSLIRRLQDIDVETFVDINRRLAPVDLREVERCIAYDVASGPDVNDREICMVGPIRVRGNAIRSLRPAEQLSAELIDGLLELFTLRDGRIALAYDDVNGRRRNFVPYKRSHYCGPRVIEELLQNPGSAALQYSNLTLSNTFRMYFIIQIKGLTRDTWQLLVIDFARKCFYYFNPNREYLSHIDAISVPSRENEFSSHTYTSQELETALNEFLLGTIGDERGSLWSFGPTQMLVRYEANEDDFSEGVYVITIMYYLCVDLPIVFTHTDAQLLRRKWVHWILLGMLPT